MNRSLALIFTVMVPFFVHAMEPVVNQPQANAACPGSQLAVEPFNDVRHHINIGNNHYCLIDNNGNGLTPADVAFLRSIVPFAIKRNRENKVIGFLTAGALIGIAGSLILDVVRSYKGLPRYHSFIPGFLIGLAGLGKALCSLRRTVSFEHQLINDMHTSLRAASTDEAALHECRHEQTPELQQRHLEIVQAERMAMGKLYIPLQYDRLLAAHQNNVRPLIHILLHADSPLNTALNIPERQRGNTGFVTSFMEIIKECES